MTNSDLENWDKVTKMTNSDFENQDKVHSLFLFVFMLYVPVNNFSVMSGWVFLG